MLTYKNNDTGKVTKKAPTKEGSYTMHVSGRGSCTGEFDVPYKVTAKDESISITKAKVSVASMAYRGAKPKATLTVRNVGTLEEGIDYTVRYANIGAKGTGTIIFTGTGKYSGVLKKTFKVKAASITDGDVRSPKARLFLSAFAMMSPQFFAPRRAMNRPIPALTACFILTGITRTTASLRPKNEITMNRTPLQKMTPAAIGALSPRWRS